MVVAESKNFDKQLLRIHSQIILTLRRITLTIRRRITRTIFVMSYDIVRQNQKSFTLIQSSAYRMKATQHALRSKPRYSGIHFQRLVDPRREKSYWSNPELEIFSMRDKTATILQLPPNNNKDIHAKFYYSNAKDGSFLFHF